MIVCPAIILTIVVIVYKFILMYVLATPYTTKAGTTPTLKMSFSVEDALDADFFKSEVAGKDDVLGCTVYVGSPGVSMSLYD